MSSLLECEFRNQNFKFVRMAYSFVNSSRGKAKLICHGYVYRHLRSRGENHYFRCEMNQCHGTAILRGTQSFDALGGTVTLGKEHSHEPEEGREEVLRLQDSLRKEGRQSTAPPQAIMQQLRQDVPIKASGNLPTEDAQRQMVQRARRRTFPAEPGTKAEIVLPDRFKVTQESQNFLLIDTFDPEHEDLGADDADSRIIAFGTEQNLRNLAKSQMWFLDGTFRTCPRMFAQLYTINGLYDGRSFPFVFALLPSKTQETYKRLFRELLAVAAEMEPSIELSPPHLMFDFERAALNAARSVFRVHSQVHGCLFHLSQNIYRKVQEEGLATDYKDNGEIQLSIKKLVALAFLPPIEIPGGFDTIKDQAPNVVLPIYRYFEDNYIRGPDEEKGGALTIHGDIHHYFRQKSGVYMASSNYNYTDPIMYKRHGTIDSTPSYNEHTLVFTQSSWSS